MRRMKEAVFCYYRPARNLPPIFLNEIRVFQRKGYFKCRKETMTKACECYCYRDSWESVEIGHALQMM